jgi:cell division protein ZapB
VRLGRVDGGRTGTQRPCDVVEVHRGVHHSYRSIARRAAAASIDSRRGHSIVIRMSEPSARTAVDAELKRLERRLDELIATIGQLKEENRALRQRQDTLMTERASLLQKNEQVRARVEAMIGRLKAMEHGS